MLRVCSGIPGEPMCGKLIPQGSRSTGYKCRECANEIQRRKRARRGSTTQRVLGAEHQRLGKQVLREESLCWLCGEPARPGDPLEVDHVVPRSKGGLTVRENLRAAHRTCNRSRGAGGRANTQRGTTDSSTSVSWKSPVESQPEGGELLLG
jgi:5-methylcytosine-specific restriction endonuclease McrA